MRRCCSSSSRPVHSRRRSDAADREDAARVFDARRDDALRARWELVIQREAVGIRRNDIIERLYPIPPRAARRSTEVTRGARIG